MADEITAPEGAVVIIPVSESSEEITKVEDSTDASVLILIGEMKAKIAELENAFGEITVLQVQSSENLQQHVDIFNRLLKLEMADIQVVEKVEDAIEEVEKTAEEVIAEVEEAEAEALPEIEIPAEEISEVAEEVKRRNRFFIGKE